MKEYQSKDIRNFAIVGHGSSGKTMFSECMLACGGEITRLGGIEAGNTTSDFSAEEQKRQISINATMLHTEWLKNKFNILDTPGYSDFIGEALSCLRVADTAVVVVHAIQGVEVGTHQLWDYATKFNVPKMLVINALDREHANFDNVVAQAKEAFGNGVMPVTVPLNQGLNFTQVLDVLNKKVVTYQTDGMGQCTEEDASGDIADKAQGLYEQLVETVAESDDALLEKFFEDGTLSAKEVQAGLSKAMLAGSLVPLFAVSGSTNVGVATAMNFMSTYGASPEDRAVTVAKNGSDEDVSVELTNPETSIFIFKTISDPHVGELALFKVYSGKVESGLALVNRNKKGSERLGQFYALNGKKRDGATQLNAGDIAAAVKLKDTSVGHTLSVQKFDVCFDQVEYPMPNIHSAIKPKTQGDEEKMAVGLSAIHDEDPTFSYRVDSELKQTIISGQGELHLDVMMSKISERYNVVIDMFQPKVPYRETIRSEGTAKYRHKKQSGGAGQFAEVHLKVARGDGGDAIEFVNSLVGQNVDRVFVPSVEKGVRKACVVGPLAGYKVINIKANFYDGKQHPVDSKDIAFQIAGEKAFQEACLAAKPCLLEPITKISVKVPEEYMGDIMGDISGRRGKILGMDSEGNFQIINALVPQSELHHYSTTIRSITGGRGIHTEEFDHYDPAPAEIEKKVVAESKEEE